MLHHVSSSSLLLLFFILQLFYSFFKTLIGSEIRVELKNNVTVIGTLVSVDQFLNLKLNNISVDDPEKCPHLLSVKNCFIRGSVIRYVSIPPEKVDIQLLEDHTRLENRAEPRP